MINLFAAIVIIISIIDLLLVVEVDSDNKLCHEMQTKQFKPILIKR